jgi:hypothetical protein
MFDMGANGAMGARKARQMISVSWSITLQVTGNQALSVTRAPLDVQAIDRIEAVIAPGDSDKPLQIQPGGLAAIRLLLVTSSSYGSHISFKVSDGASDSAAVTLDSPQLFSGGGIAIFTVAPHQLKFTNTSTDKPATVQIYVARDAAV